MTTEAENSATLAVVEKFNAAFNRHDVDAVMNAITEDCIFENTNPAPDGARTAETCSGSRRARRRWGPPSAPDRA